MQGFILTAITAAVKCTLVLDLASILTKATEREIEAKGTWSWCVLEECVKDNY